MIKTKFARIIDTTLFVVGFSIICFAWINKYIKISFLSLFITAIISFIIAKTIWDLSTKKFNKKNLKTQELKFAQNCIDYLTLNPNQTLSFFKTIIDNSAIKGKFLLSPNAIHYFDYCSDQTSTQTLCALQNKIDLTHTKAYLYSSKLSEKCAKLITQTNVVWVKDYDCYLLMKEKQRFPITQQKSEQLQKHKFKQAFLQALARKKAKTYFFYGALLLLTSFIMPYSLLYCIVGTISIVMALICLLVKNNQQINGTLS